ncbi:Ankyrin repeat-containing protein ITN1 [Sesamum alatum]|uniref:Ankyrin repeat-containing protein ITN1 n=1 Tax=Sesamum alatum TaxID=300844 RepID=A0AAE1Z1E0_9LAMI|nr:Ankyrin repeat-containing protein ITN1 [Sesamum alatum]
MQRELLWFKEVEKVVPPSHLEERNRQGLRPRELFSKKHKSLLANGEKWMKETANNCMIVATLIATVAFAAAFTLPGGNNGDTGMPILIKRTWFTVFAVSNAVALFCSTASVITFLSILTSRYQEDDFLVSLPTKLMFGLTTLMFSIVGVIFAFTTTFFLLFNDQHMTSLILKWFALLPVFYLLHYLDRCTLSYATQLTNWYLERFSIEYKKMSQAVAGSSFSMILFFDSDDCQYWNIKMRIFLKAEGLWVQSRRASTSLKVNPE